MFDADADRPIVKSSQDRLNRTTFARYLARCILDHQDPESLVIGLYGGFGVGKSSLINLVLEELNFAASNMWDDEKPVILNFSPWSYSGQNQLVYSFFRRLSSALRSVTYVKNSDRIIHLLELYVSFFTNKPIPKALREKRSRFAKLFFPKKEDTFAWESGRDLTLVKAELNTLLQQQKHKIIIIIDNISRLYDDEIKQIFQIVKSMGDYANTAYLLAFDKERVIRAVNKIDGRGGEELIEKVVQLPFEVPPISQQDLENIFADRLKSVLAIVPEDAWKGEYWADVYHASLKYFFKNCRDITRYVNTLNFSYSRLKDLVDPVDYFSLTAIEVFTPDVYFGIHDNKDLFTDLIDNVFIFDENKLKKDKSRCEEILARTERISRERLLELLMHLFPRLRRMYQPEVNFYHSKALARKNRRICSPDMFDIYFRLSLPTGRIPGSEFETILAQAADEEAFDQALTRLNQDDRGDKFIDLLDSDAVYNIPKENIPYVVNALLDNGDLFPEGITGPFSLNTPMRIHRIIHRLLRRIDDPEERFIIFQNEIAKTTKSIYIIIHELTEQGREHEEEEDTYLPLAYRDLTPEQLDLLRKLAVSRIQYWADIGRLVEHPRLLPILQAWKSWGKEEDCKRYLRKMVETDRGLLAFLIAVLNEPVAEAITQYAKNPLWQKYLIDIEAFIPVNELIPHAKILFEDLYFEKLREKEQLALMIFLDLTHVKTTKIIPKTTV